jgi:DNA topoisomerase IA
MLISIFFRYGQKYVSEDIRKYLKKVKNAQEAHEAIRPTSIRRPPCNDSRCVFVDLSHFSQLQLLTIS